MDDGRGTAGPRSTGGEAAGRKRKLENKVSLSVVSPYHTPTYRDTCLSSPTVPLADIGTPCASSGLGNRASVAKPLAAVNCRAFKPREGNSFRGERESSSGLFTASHGNHVWRTRHPNTNNTRVRKAVGARTVVQSSEKASVSKESVSKKIIRLGQSDNFSVRNGVSAIGDSSVSADITTASADSLLVADGPTTEESRLSPPPPCPTAAAPPHPAVAELPSGLRPPVEMMAPTQGLLTSGELADEGAPSAVAKHAAWCSPLLPAARARAVRQAEGAALGLNPFAVLEDGEEALGELVGPRAPWG